MFYKQSQILIWKVKTIIFNMKNMIFLRYDAAEPKVVSTLMNIKMFYVYLLGIKVNI